MLRSMDQAERTHEAMTVRGYHGALPIPNLPPLGAATLAAVRRRRCGDCEHVRRSRKVALVSDISGPLAIETEAIGYTYPDGIAALADVTFHARPGEFVAVMGANGAGKTTLMKSLMRLVRPQRGQIRLGGPTWPSLPPAELYGKIGMVFQNPADQLFAATVEEDVAFGPRNLGLAEAEVARRIEEALAEVDALPLRGRPIHHLSFGEQKRAAWPARWPCGLRSWCWMSPPLGSIR